MFIILTLRQHTLNSKITIKIVDKVIIKAVPLHSRDKTSQLREVAFERKWRSSPDRTMDETHQAKAI